MFGQGKPDKEQWLKEAEEAYEKVFGPRDKVPEGGRPLTFSEIEEEAVREGNKLARWLLEGKISRETDSSGCHAEQCTCPHCGKPAKRKREDLDTRELQTRPGAVSFERYEYHCCSCRRSFFPSGHPAEPQD
jgi:hypothetical protein